MKSKLSRSLIAAGLTCIFGINSSGCANFSESSYFHDVHLNKSHMNRDAFKDLADFDKKLSTLTKTMDEEQVFNTLGLDKNRFSIIARQDIVKFLTGGTNPTPQTKEALDYNIEQVNRSRIYTLQFKEVDEHGALKGFASSQTEKAGFDMQMMLIFQDGKLYDARASGTPHVNGKEIHYVWEIVGEGLKGVVIGGGAVTGAKMLK